MAAALALISAPAWPVGAVGLLVGLGAILLTDVNPVSADPATPSNSVTGFRSTSVSTGSVSLSWDVYTASSFISTYTKYQLIKKLSGDSWPSEGTVRSTTHVHQLHLQRFFSQHQPPIPHQSPVLRR